MGVLGVGDDLGHPAVVAAQRAAQLQSLSHFAAPEFFCKNFTVGKSGENCASKTQNNLAFNIGGGQEHNLIILSVSSTCISEVKMITMMTIMLLMMLDVIMLMVTYLSPGSLCCSQHLLKFMKIFLCRS